MHILTTGAYRLFFPAAGLFAALVIPFWLVLYMDVGLSLPEDSFRWHQHEMLFGYLGAALVGFLLTAIPNWTGRPALKGAPLLGLFGMWVAARIGFVALPEGGLQIGIALLFPVMMAGLATREIWLGGSKRNLPVAGLVWFFAASDAVFLLGDVELGKRMGFAVAMMMITLVGGRVTPAFSRNWLKAKARPVLIAGFGLIDKAAMAAAIFVAMSWVVLDDHQITGILGLVASALVAARLVRWKGWAVVSEPLLVFMHLAYLWLPLSMLLLGLSVLGFNIGMDQVAHAIGAGAVGAMTLIVMMRAILGHANRPIVGGGWDFVILASVHIGAVLRVASPVFDDSPMLLHGSGVLWAFGFVVFFVRYGRIALLPRL